MKKSVFVLTVVMFIACLSTGYSQGTKKPEKETTVKGEVVDVSCYLAHGKNGTGDDHKSCAQACAQHGGPLGILTSDGKLYVSVMPDDHKAGPNEILMEHIAQTITATGKIRSKNGVHGIMITKVDMAEEGQKKEENK